MIKKIRSNPDKYVLFCEGKAIAGVRQNGNTYSCWRHTEPKKLKTIEEVIDFLKTRGAEDVKKEDF